MFEAGDRIVRKSNEWCGFVVSTEKRRAWMVEVRWDSPIPNQWLPAEEFREWDKSDTPPPTMAGYKNRTAPEYLSRIRGSKQCQDERNKRKARLSTERLEKLGDALCKLSPKKKQRSRNKAKKIVAPWVRKENLDVQYKTTLQRDGRLRGD